MTFLKLSEKKIFNAANGISYGATLDNGSVSKVESVHPTKAGGWAVYGDEAESLWAQLLSLCHPQPIAPTDAHVVLFAKELAGAVWGILRAEASDRAHTSDVIRYIANKFAGK